MPQNSTAYAWLPDQEDADTEDLGVQLAIDWIQQFGSGRPVVVANTLGQTLPAELTRLNHRRLSPQGRGRLTGPVIAYKPSETALGLALTASRGNALVVIEGSFHSVDAWAAGVGAMDLFTGGVLPEPLAEDVRKALDSTISFGGNNAWSGGHEKSHAIRHLAALVHTGRLTADHAASYVLAQGKTTRAAKGIRMLIDTM